MWAFWGLLKGGIAKRPFKRRTIFKELFWNNFKFFFPIKGLSPIQCGSREGGLLNRKSPKRCSLKPVFQFLPGVKGSGSCWAPPFWGEIFRRSFEKTLRRREEGFFPHCHINHIMGPPFHRRGKIKPS